MLAGLPVSCSLCSPFGFVKVTKVARMLSAKPVGFEYAQKACTVMALLDGGMLKRHRNWLKVLLVSDQHFLIVTHYF